MTNTETPLVQLRDREILPSNRKEINRIFGWILAVSIGLPTIIALFLLTRR